jgi:hypothetical protein
MSLPYEEVEQPQVEEPSPPPLKPNTLRGMVLIPEIRNYLISGLAALAMIFLIHLQSGSDVGGFMLLLLGAAGIFFRWPAVPTFFLIILTWFQIFPIGIPPAFEAEYEIRRRHFWVADVLLAFSVLVYLASHFRVYGMTVQATPFEHRFPRKRFTCRRPPKLVLPGELAKLLFAVGSIVIVGQVLWYLVTMTEIDVTADFPLHLAKDSFLFRRRGEELSYYYTRLIVLAGLGFFFALLGRLVLGYWRLRIMSTAEGAMIVQDAGWDQTRRENTRLETWRFWTRQAEKADTNKSKTGAQS